MLVEFLQQIFFVYKLPKMRSLLLRGELTYGDEAKGWVREARQGDSRLVEVGGLVCKRDRVVRIGSVARDITSKTKSER